MMPAIICGQALSKSAGSPPLDIHESRRCFFSRASSSRASRKRSSSFRRAKSSSQIRLFLAFSLSHLICASMSTSFSASFRYWAIYLCGLVPHTYGIPRNLAISSLHLVLLGCVRLDGKVRADNPHARGRELQRHSPLRYPSASSSFDFRSLRLCLVRLHDRARGRRAGRGHLGTRGAASQCHLRREISQISNPSALCIV